MVDSQVFVLQPAITTRIAYAVAGLRNKGGILPRGALLGRNSRAL